MFSNFSEEAKKILILSHKEMNDLKHTYVGTEHLILSILKIKESKVCKALNKNGINYDNFKESILKIVGYGKKGNEWFIYTPLLKRIIEEAIIIAREHGNKYVETIHLLIALIEEGDGVALRIFSFMNVDTDKMFEDIKTGITYKSKVKNKKLMVEEYGYSMNDKALEGKIDPVVGRDEEINRIIEILCRRIKNNPLLLGEAGVGKTAIIEELSNRIINNTVPNKLKNKTIISLSMASLVAGTKYRGEFEERINKILSEIESNQEIILFIDEIHTLVGAGGADGAIDASNILKPFLARGNVRIIGATTFDEYKKFLENDRALDRRFQTVVIKEPNNDTLFKILKKIKPLYENFHNVLISDESLKTIIFLSNKYIYNRTQPDKAIDILDEVCSKTSIQKSKNDERIEGLIQEIQDIKSKKNVSIISQNFKKAMEYKNIEDKINSNINKCLLNKRNYQKKTVSNKMIAKVVRDKTNIPIYEFINEDKKALNCIEKTLNKQIIGQKEVISELSNDIKFIKLGYKDTNKPRSYLFVGPTGVGKTFLAKLVSNIISSGEFIRMDMSEYKESHSVSKIIGSPPGYVGYESKNNILEEVKIKPNAVLLLDEIEKAHKDVISLFFQILDEGFIKNSNNELIRFDNITIVMTSNLGYKKNSIGFNSEKKEYVIDSLKNYLVIEFVNRIDKIFSFNNLKEEDIKKIIINEIKQINTKYNEKFALKPSLINKIIKESKYMEFGARKIKMLIEEEFNNYIIKEKINKKVKITIETT